MPVPASPYARASLRAARNGFSFGRLFASQSDTLIDALAEMAMRLSSVSTLAQASGVRPVVHIITRA